MKSAYDNNVRRKSGESSTTIHSNRAATCSCNASHYERLTVPPETVARCRQNAGKFDCSDEICNRLNKVLKFFQLSAEMSFIRHQRC